MSVKDLFKRSHSVIASSSLETMGAEVESADYFEPYIKDQDRLEPHVDFSDPANFVKYGSAEQYYDTAIKWIWGNYPYDGSLKEKLEWRNQSTLLDLYIYDVRYPKTTGYATFAPTRWGALTSSGKVDIGGDGYGAPSETEHEYINLKGGPGTPYGQSIGTASLKGVFDSKANVWDADVTGSGTRESNLKTNLSSGITVEFWLQTGSLSKSLTERQVVFDMWNNQASSSAEYGRFKIEIVGNAGADSAVPDNHSDSRWYRAPMEQASRTRTATGARLPLGVMLMLILLVLGTITHLALSIKITKYKLNFM